jgi:O-phosphoseryl-tRNA(Cys) synthetase
MTNYKKTARLCDTDAAYIAGLIDGEGTVTLGRKHRNENRQLVVSISNNEIALLEFVLNSVRTGKITAKRKTRPHHANSYTYAVYNRQALALLEQVQPYLKTCKAKRAEIILRDYIRLTPRNGKYTDEQLRERKAFEKRVLAIKPS